MSFAGELLGEVQNAIKVPKDEIDEVRRRRDIVRAVAKAFPGALRSYASGSIAHRTAIKSDSLDADCGVVLDRRTFPNLGPDGDGDGPELVMNEVAQHLLRKLATDFPYITANPTKRAVLIEFHTPLTGGFDPSADLIVALTRKDAQGLWIPNRDTGGWDASHPEKHTELLRADPADLRRARARVIRLAKAWNKQEVMPGLSSFNLSALALASVRAVDQDEHLLRAFFRRAATSLKRGDTPDPAGVSGRIRLLGDRDTVVGNLGRATEWIDQAIEADDDDQRAAQSALANVFPDYLDPPPASRSKQAIAAALRQGNARVGLTAGGGLETLGHGESQRNVPETRSWGSR